MVFLDLRGFTAFAETAEPEEVMGVLREYHAEMGRLILAHEGTLERFTGDGMMIFFNDPLPCPDPAARAVRMAVEMRARVGEVQVQWRRRGHQLAFGVGVALGYATLGTIGFEGRFDYAAIGPEHAALHETGRAEYTWVDDAAALEAFQRLARDEGILQTFAGAGAVEECGTAEQVAPRPGRQQLTDEAGRLRQQLRQDRVRRPLHVGRDARRQIRRRAHGAMR